MDALISHPEWWLRDDAGNLIPFGGKRVCRPDEPAGICPRAQIDTSVAAAQDFFANLSVSLFHEQGEAARLLDGVMVDGTSWSGPSRYGPNVSAARYEKLFAGKMTMLAKMQAILKGLNGGEVWGNPLLEYGQIGPPGHEGESTGADWNTTMAYYDGAFDEMVSAQQLSLLCRLSFAGIADEDSRALRSQFGGFGTMDKNGSWDVSRMRYSFESILNASAAGKTIIIHAFPGPAGTTEGGEGMFPTRGNVATGNTFHVAQWAGPTRVPATAAACRAAAAARLVESLAPFLIVASERVFFGYGWFYNLEDGYLPCPSEIECGMPGQWFLEYSKPLGPPVGPATFDGTKTVWQRRFAHAAVSVDLRDRSLSKIVWD